MPPPRDDHALLRAYVERRDESAFAELVQRYADMVYGSAMRQVGRGGLAEDVTQATFILLARKAATMSDQVVVAAWLHKATRYTALNALKIERRRQIHERRAAEQAALQFAASARIASGINAEIQWANGAALLDECIAGLCDKDREAVVLRFLERRSFFDVGQALGVSEEAAQMRVGRAIEKLRGFFRRRGLAVSALTLMTNASLPSTAPAAFKSVLASSVLETIRIDTALPSAIAHSAGHSMKLSAAKTAATAIGSSAAAAVIMGLLLASLSKPTHLELIPPAKTESSRASSGEGLRKPAPNDHRASLWAGAPTLAAAKSVSEIIAPR